MQTTVSSEESATTVRTGKPAFSSNSIRSGEPLSNLIHKIGHEIGNPLTAIISLATIMERFNPKADAGERTGTYAGSIIEEAWRISSLTERLVLLLSQRPAACSTVSVEKTLKTAAARLTRLKEFAPVDLELHCPASIPEAAIDSEQLKVLLQELMRNAFQAVLRARDSGREEILDDLDCSTVLVELSHREDRVLIEVSNFALAPVKAELSDLFNPFVTGFPELKLLGLGLTVVWAVAERFGATVELREVPSGSGVRFTAAVSLPTKTEERAEPPAKAAAANPFALKTAPVKPAAQAGVQAERRPCLPSKLSVLIVEDEEQVASAIQKMLSLSFSDPQNLRCATAKGKAALELLESGERFDVILCDLNLGDTSGRYIFDKISGSWPEQAQRFGFLTGERSRKETETYLSSTGRPSLYKPFEMEQLIGLVCDLASEGRN